MAHIYVEQTLVARGYLEVLKMLPTREMDEQPLDWLERCDTKMEAWLSVGHVNRDVAERAIGCAEHLATELQRFPVMVGWCHREYIVAVNNRLDPGDNSRRYKLASECELPGDGEDDFIERTLLGLLA
jgi:hypothetical protein